MNKIHLPMELTQHEKRMVMEYNRVFKHSPLSIKMLLCAYYGSHYKHGYIDFESYLTSSVSIGKTAKYSSYVTEDESLICYWNMKHYWKRIFFGFDRDTIMEGTISDVESMVTEAYVNYINKENDTQAFVYGIH